MRPASRRLLTLLQCVEIRDRDGHTWTGPEVLFAFFNAMARKRKDCIYHTQTHTHRQEKKDRMLHSPSSLNYND
jgi:hypothetical protein